jgi:phosphoribosylamine---glycine ligase
VYDTARAARETLRNMPWPVVLKADGLCAGKGVLVATSYEEGAAFVDRVLERREFGTGGARLMMEGALSGPELSLILLTDGERFAPLVPCRDHKRAFDGDRGPNTGGMGVYSSDDLVSPDMYANILETIVEPTMAALAADGEPYRGFLYFGLMLTPTGPSVLEFNCRLGDPETQAIIPRADFDLAEVLFSAAAGNLAPGKVKWKPGASVCVVMASGGYPETFEVGKPISGLAQAAALKDVAIFHAGTKASDNNYYTCSGRVLAVTAIGPTLSAAREKSYGTVQQIQFAGAQYRTDIAAVASRASEVGHS